MTLLVDLAIVAGVVLMGVALVYVMFNSVGQSAVKAQAAVKKEQAALAAPKAKKDRKQTKSAKKEAAPVEEEVVAAPAPVSAAVAKKAEKASKADKKAAKKAEEERRQKEDAEIEALIARDMKKAQKGMATDKARVVTLDEVRQAAKKDTKTVAGPIKAEMSEAQKAKAKSSGFKIIEKAETKKAAQAQQEEMTTKKAELDRKLNSFFKSRGGRGGRGGAFSGGRGGAAAGAEQPTEGEKKKKAGGKVSLTSDYAKESGKTWAADC